MGEWCSRSTFARCRRSWIATMLLVAAAPVVAADLGDVRALIAAGSYKQALAAVEKRLDSNPTDPELRFFTGVIYARLGRTDDAIEVFERLTKDYPGLPEPYNNLAVLHAAQGEYEKARDDLLIAIRTHPSYATAHENLGDIYARMAGEAYDKALSLDAGNEAAKAKLALIDQLFSMNGTGAAAAAAPATSPAAGSSTAVASSAPAVEPAAAAKPAQAAEPARTAEAAPAAEPAPGAVDEQLRSTAIDLVRAWAGAWSARDPARYLAFYSTSFRPDGGITRAAWERQRRKRLRKPRFIEIALDGFEVEMIDHGALEVRFDQSYRSDTYADHVRKALQLVREDGRWRIASERVLR